MFNQEPIVSSINTVNFVYNSLNNIDSDINISPDKSTIGIFKSISF